MKNPPNLSPKYRVGDIVYFCNGSEDIVCAKIQYIIFDITKPETDFSYQLDGWSSTFREERLFGYAYTAWKSLQ